MDEILVRMFLASIIKSVKNPQKKAKLRNIAREAVLVLLLTYHDDPTFLDEDGDGVTDIP